jgi:hypothetical protein
MKGQIIVAFATLLLVALSVPVAAQSSNIDVSIPYDFMVGSRKLAAGSYSINRPMPADPRVFSFRGDVKHQKTLVTTKSRSGDEPAPNTELTFARYGDVYFLRSVRMRGAREVYEVPISKVEKAAAAKGDAVMVTVTADGA